MNNQVFDIQCKCISSFKDDNVIYGHDGDS